MITIFIRIRIGRGEGGGIMHDDIELHETKKGGQQSGNY